MIDFKCTTITLLFPFLFCSQVQQMRLKDSRIKLTTQVLNGIKVIRCTYQKNLHPKQPHELTILRSMHMRNIYKTRVVIDMNIIYHIWATNISSYKNNWFQFIWSTFQVLKFYAWEPAFEQRITAIRNNELKLLRRVGLLFALNQATLFSSGFIVRKHHW